MRKSQATGFTLIEILAATAAFAITSLGLFAVAATTMRLMARNLATNHSHETARTAGNRIMSDLHDSASPFSLINASGTSYTTVVPAATADVDVLSGKNLSQRANGVAFRVFAGGPYPIIASGTIGSSATSLTFDFGAGGGLSYKPEVGDKFFLPVIKQVYEISAVTKSPTSADPKGTVNFSPTILGYSISPSSTNMMTAYFLRRVAYTVQNNELRYHRNFTSGSLNSFIVVRPNVTSPRPFSVLFASATEPISDSENLYVSIEAYDATSYSARRFAGGTTTYKTVASARTQPIFIPNKD